MPRPARLLIVALLASVLLTGCSLFGSGAEGTVDADVIGNAVVVSNNTDDRIWTFIVGRQTAARILWGPDLTGEGIAPGETQRTPLDEVTANDDEDLLVYWWTAVRENGERVPGEIRNVRVER